MNKIVLSRLIFISIIVFFQDVHSQEKYRLSNVFDKNLSPSVPNFADLSNWAAHPEKKDMADEIPSNKFNLKDNQAQAPADVFFIYPTIYTGEPHNEYTWNASTSDIKLNEDIDTKTIKNQASVFNGSCKVYAPRYRQAHYSVFTTSDTTSARLAMALAYEDVKASFEYYLKHFNQNRPIIIASHSQGTLHAIKLLQEYFDNSPLKSQLVEAYLVGMPVNDAAFSTIKLSTKPEETGGYVSWNTFAKGFYPPYYEGGLNKAQLINPASWTNSNEWSEFKQHKGMVGIKFELSSQKVSAATHEGLLWIKKPKVFGAALANIKIWHFADYNLFWYDIRENVALRIYNFQNK